jgi:hypothetical protein
MTTYQDVFGGANIYPSEVTYSALALSADVTLSWPEETSATSNLATRIMDVTPAGAGLSVRLPAADRTSTGNTVLFSNRGASTFTVRDSAGTQVATVAGGTLWQVYLADNTTAAGAWRALQYGAAVSQANASSLAGTGIVAVGTLLSQSVPITSFNADYTAGVADRARMYNWTGAGGTFTLPSAAVVGDNWFTYLRNSGTGAIAATPSGVNTIDGAASLSFQPGESAIIACDGTNFYTIGFGKSAVFAFDYTVISVAGTGTYTLTGSELNRVAYRFTGTLTGNRTVVVPATVQQYWVDNRTTGAFTLTIAPSGAGLSTTVAQGSRSILYCDGTDVLKADTAGVSLPLSVAQGGTGATSAGAALINLGISATGSSIFTAANQAAAYAALGVAPSGVVNGGTF